MSVIQSERLWWLAPAEESVIRVSIRNDGSLGWLGDGRFSVSYHWYDRDGKVVQWDGLRKHLSSQVSPGESVTVDAAVRAPDRPGRYVLQWDVVHDGVTWVSERDPTPPQRQTVPVFDVSVINPAVWTVVSLSAVLLIGAVVGSGHRGWSTDFIEFADLGWLAVTVLVSQRAVLSEAGQNPSSTGWLLTLAGIAALLSGLLILPRRWRPSVTWAVAALAVFVLFSDLLYQRFFGDIVSLAAVMSASQLGSVRASVWSVLRAHDLWLWAQILVGVALVLVMMRYRGPGRWRWHIMSVLSVVMVTGAAAGTVMVRAGDGVLRQVFRNVYIARDVGVLNFHVYDVGRYVWRGMKSRQVSDSNFEDVVGWFRERAPMRAARGPTFGVARGFNLLMIQVESLQGFVVGLEVNGQEVTPFLNRWSDQTVLFSNVTDQTAQGRSSDSELATQVSLLPPVRGAAAFLYSTNRFIGLADVLAGRGYHTLSAVPFDGGFWNRQLTHRAYGYRNSLFKADFDPGEVIGWGLNDRAFLGQMVPLIAGLDRPFCAWLLTLSLHHPFNDFPEHHRVLNVGDWEGTPFGNFLHTMKFFDGALEELVVGLEHAGLADDTVVALWGDHDAGLDWQPALAHALGRRHDAAGWYLSQRVPLMIRVPGESTLRGEMNIAAGHQDVAPTVLALLGIDPSDYPFIGRNLLGDPGDVPVVGEYQCWQDDEHLFLQGGPRLSDGECYDLATLERIDNAACAAGYEDVLQQVEVSRLVLEYDLQKSIHKRLVDSARGQAK
jgi:phosphoglycerol transferase MdoB-like AlkP superfamily enzyme